MNTNDFEDWLDREAAALPKRIEPQRDLWPGIEARLDERGVQTPPAAPSRVWPFVSGIAATLVVALAVTQLRTEPAPPLSAEAVPPVQTVLVERPAPWVPEIARTRNQLHPGFQDGLAQLSPETRAIVEDNLAQIHRSLAEIHEALAADPGNLALHRMLASTYQLELNLISSIQSLSEPETQL